MVDNGTGLKGFGAATFARLLQVGLHLLKRFRQMQGDGDRGESIINPPSAPTGNTGEMPRKTSGFAARTGEE
jgi:hypothetical protein